MYRDLVACATFHTRIVPVKKKTPPPPPPHLRKLEYKQRLVVLEWTTKYLFLALFVYQLIYVDYVASRVILLTD
jgi:hypothetical protein